MPPIKRVVLDLLKPHEPSLAEVVSHVADRRDVAGANGILIERDREVENVELTIQGDDLDLDGITDDVEGLGGSIHSVDEVACGEVLVDAVRPPVTGPWR